MTAKRPYHHRDLRRAVLAAAIEVIRADGPAAVSLRDLARRAGVSHAAPAHHFKDKAGLLTAVAAEGHGLLASYLEEAAASSLDLADLGVAYLRFALDHPAHFEVMYRTDLLHDDDPALVANRARGGAVLASGVGNLPEGPGDTDAALAAWSLVHGFATLLLTGNLDQLINGREPVVAFRSIAGLLFAPP